MPEVLAFLRQYLLETVVGLLLLFLLAWVADRITRRVILGIVARAVRGTRVRFDDVLLEFNVFGRAAHLAPALVIYYGIRFVPMPAQVSGADFNLRVLIEHTAAAAMILIGISTLVAFVAALGQIYSGTDLAQGRPIEAYTQIAKIAVYVIGIVLFIAVLTGRSPLLLLSGIGAVTAVLLLIFRDTILGFVASLQITSYDMVRVGDWVEMGQYGADGDVIELSLHTVKVQNWDKTITAIPTHKLIEEPFRNWRGMQESGGRRIKRSFNIDVNSIRFLEDDELDRLENFVVLRDYVRRKRDELAEYNATFSADTKLIPNARRLTNVGTFRAYLKGYLRQHPRIHQGMTLLVRQLPPSSEGLPIELYVFTNTTAWGDYEDIQSDVFDHVFSIVHEFGLRVFQGPAGADFAKLSEVGGGQR
jgi:miniconductance mechanosensitive channel